MAGFPSLRATARRSAAPHESPGMHDPTGGSASAPSDEPFDLLFVGGGINGGGIARDAAGRGLRGLLVEQEELAQHTSSASTRLDQRLTH